MRRAASLISRVHVPAPLAPGAVVDLPASAAHHLAHVLRAAVGDRIVVFDQGVEYAATIARISKTGVSAKLGEGRAVDRESPLNCTLAQGVSSGERMDLTLQKAVELGIKGVQPLLSERSVVRLDPERTQKRIAHWRQIMVSACEQCGRNVIPDLAPPLPLEQWLLHLPARSECEARLLLSPQATSRASDLPRPSSIVMLAGPEGGFSEQEIESAIRCGFTGIRLGPRVLRTETAALAALAAMNVLWGDF